MFALSIFILVISLVFFYIGIQFPKIFKGDLSSSEVNVVLLLYQKTALFFISIAYLIILIAVIFQVYEYKDCM